MANALRESRRKGRNWVEMRKHGCQNGYKNTKPRRKDKSHIRKAGEEPESPETMGFCPTGRAGKWMRDRWQGRGGGGFQEVVTMWGGNRFNMQRQRGSPAAVPSGIFKVVLKGNWLGLIKNRQGLDVKNKMSGVSAAQSLWGLNRQWCKPGHVNRQHGSRSWAAG